ncbi:MAG: class I SAM-dependent methyltransferase [Eubacterium sp.]|nr:class I SAM-dependent methyltransferase [Eubacterium sp.]
MSNTGKDNKSAYNSNIYDEHIVNVLPYYTEYHGQTIDLVRTLGIKAPKWLDTGAGTGTLAIRALEVLPDAKFTLADPSEKMLDIAKQKLAGKDIKYLAAASGELDIKDEYDVVSAIQSHHYYSIEEREEAVKRCYDALKESGVFITFENIRMSTEESDDIALNRWKIFLKEHGNSDEDIQMQMDRRGVETHPITIEQHLEMLKKAGFRSVNLLWASYLQAGFWAVK